MKKQAWLHTSRFYISLILVNVPFVSFICVTYQIVHADFASFLFLLFLLFVQFSLFSLFLPLLFLVFLYGLNLLENIFFEWTYIWNLNRLCFFRFRVLLSFFLQLAIVIANFLFDFVAKTCWLTFWWLLWEFWYTFLITS